MSWRLAASACLALGAPPAIAQPQAGAAPFARQLQHLVGQQRSGVVLRAIRAEGNMLVFTLDGGTGWRAFVPIDAISRDQLAAFCRRPDVRRYFNGRRSVRVDTTEAGRRRWPGRPLSRCP